MTTTGQTVPGGVASPEERETILAEETLSAIAGIELTFSLGAAVRLVISRMTRS